MRNFFTRRPPRDPDVERALRRSLTEHARQAPGPADVTERVLAATARMPVAGPGRDAGPSRWRTWTLPLVAAGSVAAVVAAIAGIQQLDQPSAHESAAASPTSHSSRLHAPGPIPTAISSAPSQPPQTRTGSIAPPDTSTLHDVKVLDLTFAGLDDGWALATADCILKPGERCPALLRTHNGTRWHSSPNTPFNVPGQTGGCDDPCVQHLRFATDDIGYAYGPDALLMTTDGGQNWVRQAGAGALYLETLNQNVIRVTGTESGCPGPCAIGIQTAALGSSRWTTRLGPLTTPGGVEFARGGDDAYLLLTGHTAGGAQDAKSVLYRSADDGASWTRAGEPCPQAGAVEIDSTAVAAGADGRAAVLCTHRAPPFGSFAATSTDSGAHFTAQAGSIPFAQAELLTGDPATVLLAAGRGAVRSTDGGRSWASVPYRFGTVSFAGFESTQVGRVVSADGTEIWTTRDGGATWTEVRFR